MADHRPSPPAARRTARPGAVPACPSCGDLAGRGYPACRFCAELVDQHRLVDWQELLAAEQLTEGGAGERELAELVLADDTGAHPWTCIDWAMTLTLCSHCGEELGTGPVDCVRCAVADERRRHWDHTGFPKEMSALDHRLRVARVVLRAPHRHRTAIVDTWRLLLPFLLDGRLPATGDVRRLRAQVLAGGYADLAAVTSYDDLVAFPELPWRRSAPVEHQADTQRDQHATRKPFERPADTLPRQQAPQAVEHRDDDQVPAGVDGHPHQGEQQ
ncbi:hypothetical protein F4559_006156 [Saccharothrix violaceirubra]|uniref:Uncharacterized protein n=1 Tax=Saccharothrix violaceirubra TaxID=413306 RepID=A0A7W7T903_9PSEU|nr:hypothetical protein [Saccharothrix violaceirubra]